MTYTSETLAKAVRASYVASLFEDKSYHPLTQVQRNLDGRTHYADAGTLKYFSARIICASILDDGLILGFVESVAHPELGRVYRPVFFDIFGTVVERCDIEFSFKTAAAARKAFWKTADQIDAVAVTLKAMEHRAEKLLRDYEASRGIIAA